MRIPLLIDGQLRSYIEIGEDGTIKSVSQMCLENLIREIDALTDLARRLALALADEVAFVATFGEAAEASLEVLAEAQDKLGLQKE